MILYRALPWLLGALGCPSCGGACEKIDLIKVMAWRRHTRESGYLDRLHPLK